jgi:hypothetical protein
MIFVRDQERSLRFYVDKLDFRVVVDHIFETGGRWIEVAPPDGSANLALALATPIAECELLPGDILALISSQIPLYLYVERKMSRSTASYSILFVARSGLVSIPVSPKPNAGSPAYNVQSLAVAS